MKPLSIGKAWEETTAFVKREGSLLFPVAFLFMALPVVIFQQIVPPELLAEVMKAQSAGGAATVPQLPASFWIGFLVTMVIGLIGALTLYALALRPGISVGEAMRLGLQRIPVLMTAGLLVAAGTMIAIIALTLVVALFSVLGGSRSVTALVMAALIGTMMFVAARLLLLNAVAIDRPIGAVDAIRQSWRLTQGQFGRLFAFLAIVIILGVVTQAAVQSIFGVLGALIGGAEIAVLAAGLATAALSAIIQVYFLVMTARIYRQLEAAA